MKEAINAYRHVAASAEFKEVERLRSKARHDEAQALYHAEQVGMQKEREKWQTVVSDKDAQIAGKDAENEQLRLRIAELEKRTS